jgi:hypothetical protein
MSDWRRETRPRGAVWAIPLSLPFAWGVWVLNCLLLVLPVEYRNFLRGGSVSGKYLRGRPRRRGAAAGVPSSMDAMATNLNKLWMFSVLMGHREVQVVTCE